MIEPGKSGPKSKEFVLAALMLATGWTAGRTCLALGISEGVLSQWEEDLVFRILVSQWQGMLEMVIGDAPISPETVADVMAATGFRSVTVEHPDGTVIRGGTADRLSQ